MVENVKEGLSLARPSERKNKQTNGQSIDCAWTWYGTGRWFIILWSYNSYSSVWDYCTVARFFLRNILRLGGFSIVTAQRRSTPVLLCFSTLLLFSWMPNK